MPESLKRAEAESRAALLGVADGSALPRIAPWALSFLVHAALIALAFGIVWTVAAPPREDRPQIIAAFDDPGPAAASAAEAAEGSSTPAPAVADAAIPPAPSQTPTLSELLAELSPAPRVEPQEDRARQARELTQQRRLPDVRFAGVGASNARSVIYVVDASGSSISTFPFILEELRRSVARLAPTQQFQVIFFGPGGYTAAPHPADGGQSLKTIRLIRATQGNIRAVLEWCARIEPRERSNPIPALEIALSLRPDAVFVLSMAITGLGVWEPDKATLLQQLDALNPIDERSGRRPAMIKTIQLFEDDPAGILRAIGEAHGGSDGYKFLSRQEVFDQ
jgi:hypothetical protein